ncbi:hypothetical protein CLV92_11666 [Kineococcus xinjiangensis]|uniref:Uncharacterized protein n=1 Tax=Kineococcus xinjiangensis TaxID=512762 RepID=A0A2S6IDA4_9ACTN|nr:hypothetical protein [Kineococcus xinjiangensis]PPK92204.1 hypothetical protein CLV92_11666 [Kineococcus xinjiangensis]
MNLRDGEEAEKVARRLMETTDEELPSPHSLVTGAEIPPYRVEGAGTRLALLIVCSHPCCEFVTGFRLDLDGVDEWWAEAGSKVNTVARSLAQEIGELFTGAGPPADVRDRCTPGDQGFRAG